MRPHLVGIIVCALASAANARAGFAAERFVLHDAAGAVATAAKVRDVIYVPAVNGLDRDARNPGDVARQARRALDRLDAVLRQAGSGVDLAVSVTVFLRDPDDLAAVDRVSARYWKKTPPARTVLVTTQPFADGRAALEIALVAAPRGTARSAVLPPGWPPPPGPYSYGLWAGHTLFLSGLLGQDPVTGRPVAGDVQTQTRQILDNAGVLLRTAGLTVADVAAVRLFFAGENDVPAVNAVYNPFFGKTLPARHGVRAGMIGREYLVTLNFVAVRPGEGRSVRRDAPGSLGIDGRLYLTGIIAPTPGTRGDVRVQLTACLARASTVLSAAGYNWVDVVETIVYLPDMSRHGEVGDTARRVLGRDLPAATLVGMGLINDAAVELAIVAAR